MIRPAFLRAPPFPGVDPASIAISAPCDEGATDVPDAILSALATARVGGNFWGERITGIRRVVRGGTAVSPDRLAGAAIDEVGVLFDSAAVAPTPLQGARILPPTCDPWALIAQAEAVHAPANDDLAIIAGLLEVPVFDGDDMPVAPDRLRQAARDRIGAARYRDCFRDSDATLAEVVEILADWRRHLDGNRGIVAAVGMAFWKRDAIRHFLWDGRRSPPFLTERRAIGRASGKAGMVAIWPSRVSARMRREAADRAVPLCQIEDGFLRSRGLGAALHPPSSVVVDRSGIYYDARGPSDLETVLATHPFPPDLVDRAARLRTRICAEGLSKYGMQSDRAFDLPAGRRTILAVGQVGDDLSVRLGGAGIQGNLAFLKAVRQAEPDAWIIYRPHPDVRAGHRKGHVPDAVALGHVDQIDEGASLMPLIHAIDAVHVLSSLTGFEALIRGKPVVVHGSPFFAGWGLTQDMAGPVPRRGRQLTVDQLVAATLILYPRYLDPVKQVPCGPEILVERMIDGAMPRATWLVRARALQGKLRRYMTLSAEFFRG